MDSSWLKGLIRPKFNTITSEIVMKIIIGSFIITLISSGIAYGYVYQRSEDLALSQLKDFTTYKIKKDSDIFELAKENLQIFEKEFLTNYETAPPNLYEEFDDFYFKDEFGATRLRREYFDGKILKDGISQKYVSAFISNRRTEFSNELKRRLILGYQLIARMGPGTSNRFANLHATLPENAIILYWADEPWGLNAKPGLDMTAGAVVKASLQASNPERKPVWSGLYYDLTAKDWMITYQRPVDYKGKHVITPSHDVYLTSLINDFITESMDGSYNMVISMDGNLIAHPDKLDEIKKNDGILHISKLNDPAIQHIYDQVSNVSQLLDGGVKVIVDKKLNAFISVGKIEGPGWLFLTVYPIGLIADSAQTTAFIVLVSGLTFLIVIICMVYVIVRSSVLYPFQLLKQAVVMISKGNYSAVALGNVQLPEPELHKNEIGLFSEAFRKMSQEIHNSNQLLETQVEERTRELAVANDQLKQLILLDGLTGVNNRRSFDEDIEQLITEQALFCIMLCDIDFFKNYNDAYGHDRGDSVLKTITASLKKNCGETGRVYRFGGEEIAVIFRNTEQTIAYELSLALIRGIADLGMKHGGSPLEIVTISAGFESFDPAKHKDASALIQDVDRKLYVSKKNGKNRLTFLASL
ncbi:sensor domain-containing diguanylate cyclase [Paenibacillus agricola]|uniref:Diguanylate cyclase n=1 Tax=Paenibacillus agricola TaxID=2716264 RepID=A0ABX0J9N6_9BACL|nr:diguanylate cyclase [Paenibacillus agricola]NHN31924.1 diguanylate cyclase [Paenibacillus agricola]